MSISTHPIILIKYGGNAMTDDSLKHRILQNICSLKSSGFLPVIVHGGGPFIQAQLDRAGLKSKFIQGQRATGPDEMTHVEMALRGQVNGELVRLINTLGVPAVGISGKDAVFAKVKPMKLQTKQNGVEVEHDLGRVGEITSIDPTLPLKLLEAGYLPVINSVCTGMDGYDYNVNADIFAGHMAAALKAKELIILTDVDGLYEDINDPSTLIPTLNASTARSMITEGILKGGMIPKIESCLIALDNGAGSARIVNGTKPELLEKINDPAMAGTHITSSL